MPTRKIDTPVRIKKRPVICIHPDHEPPSMEVFSPGVYEHECPGCKAKKRFVVRELPSLR